MDTGLSPLSRCRKTSLVELSHPWWLQRWGVVVFRIPPCHCCGLLSLAGVTSVSLLFSLMANLFMHPLVQTPWNCSLPHPSKRCCILVSGRCHNEKEGSSPARLNPSLPNPGYSLGTWNSPPAVRLWDLLPSPAYPQFKRDKSPLLIHQIPHGREKQCRRSLLLSRAAWDKLAQGSKVSLRCPGWRKRISFIHRQHSGHQPQRLSQTFSRQSAVLPLSISSSLNISRWPR